MENVIAGASRSWQRSADTKKTTNPTEQTLVNGRHNLVFKKTQFKPRKKKRKNIEKYSKLHPTVGA